MDYGELLDRWNNIQRKTAPYDAACEAHMQPFLDPINSAHPSTLLGLLYRFLNYFKDQRPVPPLALRTVKHKIRCVAENRPVAPYRIHQRKILIMPNGGMGDQFTMVAAVRYYSMIYDEVVVGVRDKYADNVRQIYGDDASIRIYAFSGPCAQNTTLPAPFLDQFRAAGYEILVPSVNCWGGPVCGYPCADDVPFYRAFYVRCGLNFDLRWRFSHLNRNRADENALFERLGLNAGDPYVFAHGDAWVLSQAEIIGGGLRVVVPEGPIMAYCTVLERATYLCLGDSAFFCLAVLLKPQARQKYVYVRPYEPDDYAAIYTAPATRYMAPGDHWVAFDRWGQPRRPRNVSRPVSRSRSRSKLQALARSQSVVIQRTAPIPAARSRSRQRFLSLARPTVTRPAPAPASRRRITHVVPRVVAPRRARPTMVRTVRRKPTGRTVGHARRARWLRRPRRV